MVVGDEREGGPAKPRDLERRLVASPPPGEELHRLPGEREISGPAAVAAAAAGIHAADQFGIEADPRREGEPASVRPSQRDSPLTRREERPSGLDRIERDAEGASDDVRPPAGKDADRRPGPETVEDLVEKTVPPEDEHRLHAVKPARELGGMVRPLRPRDRQLEAAPQLRLDRGRAVVADRARERVDDQGRALHRTPSMPAEMKRPAVRRA